MAKPKTHDAAILDAIDAVFADVSGIDSDLMKKAIDTYLKARHMVAVPATSVSASQRSEV